MAETFSVTHPFHPWHGRSYGVLAQKYRWGDQRVYFQDEQDRLRSLPLAWTSLAAPDPFVARAAGRAFFRPADLLAVALLCQRLDSVLCTGRGHDEQSKV